MMPVSTVEKQGFKKLMSVMNAKYALPQLHIPDMWSSCLSEPYMSLTIRYVDNECCEALSLQSRCLRVAYFPDDHTVEKIAQGFSGSSHVMGTQRGLPGVCYN